MKKRLLSIAVAFISMSEILVTSPAILNWRLKLPPEILEKPPAIIHISRRLGLAGPPIAMDDRL